MSLLFYESVQLEKKHIIEKKTTKLQPDTIFVVVPVLRVKKKSVPFKLCIFLHLMIRTSRNIAFSLCLVFFFPVAWQSVHRYQHAGHRHHTDPGKQVQIGHYETQCAICAYEFAKTDRSEKALSLNPSGYHAIVVPYFLQAAPEFFSGYYFTLRAPPALCQAVTPVG